MTAPSISELDLLSREQLIDEIRQITEQYQKEVTTSRRNWPASVKARALALVRLGMRKSEVGRQCGIPSATIYLWSPSVKKCLPQKTVNSAVKKQNLVWSESRFFPLKPSDSSLSIPTVGMEVPTAAVPAIRSFEVVLPGGVEIRGWNSVMELVNFYRGIRA
jgi:hypothetical protein